MRPSPLVWQSFQWQQLLQLQAQDKLPHALMLAGPGEIGKRHFALTLAQQLLCHTPVDGLPCADCKACHLFKASTHPDFLLVEPEAVGKAIKVDQIRQLAEFATRTASMGENRVIVVSPAEAMNLNAANAFLKTLEEPGQGVLIILVVHQPGVMLPTIRSRCRILSFPLPDREQVFSWLSEKVDDTEQVNQSIQLSGGRPFRARRLLETELKDQLDLFQATLAAVEERKMAPLDAARIVQGMPAEDVLEWFQYNVYNRIKTPQDNSAALRTTLFRFLDRLTQVRQRLLSSANPNPQLAWEEVLMDWKSVIDLQR